MPSREAFHKLKTGEEMAQAVRGLETCAGGVWVYQSFSSSQMQDLGELIRVFLTSWLSKISGK